MKRASMFGLAVTTALVASLAPTVSATPAAVQDNVRHIANVPGTTGGHVVVEGDRLYMGNYGIGMSVYDVSDPTNPVQLGTYRPGRAVADAVPDAAHYPERKIAVLGGTNRAPGTTTTDWLDVTNPASPQLLFSWNSGVGAESHNTDIVDERKLYIASGNGQLRIFDISPLLNTPPAAPTLLSSANPATLWASSPFRGGRSTGGGFSHIHDVQVYTDVSVLLPEEEWIDQDGDEVPDPTYGPKDLALLAEGGNYLSGNNSGSFLIVDITDPRNPVARLRWRSTTGHPLRYYHEAQLLDADPHIAFVSDEDLHNGCDAGGLVSLRLSDDYTEATKLDEWFNGLGTPATVCSAHVFSSHGDYVFMGSYNAGLQVIDFSDPANLTRAGQYIAEGANAWGATYHDGYVYTGDFGARGLDVYQFLAKPAAAKVLKVPNPTTDQQPGVSETLGECDPASPADGLDGMVVPIPADKRGDDHVIRAVGTSEAGEYDIDVWFYNSNCQLLSEGHVATVGTDEEGPIHANAAFAYVDLWIGTPQMVYVQLDPPF